MPRISELDPLPWQTEFLRAGLSGDWPSDAAAVRGGLGSGKSLALCALAILICETRPGALVVVGMDTFRRLRDVHLPHLHGLLAGSAVTFAASEQAFVWSNGSRLLLAHLDTPQNSGPGSSPIEGLNAHAVLVDECQVLRPDVLDVARSRARVPVADMSGRVHRPVVVTCGVPVEPAWWVERTREIGGEAYLPQSAENARHLGAGWLERMRETLSERDYAALVENRPLPPVGSVFHAWAPEKCVAEVAVDYGQHRVMLAMDFGLRHPCALLLVELGKGRWHITREWAPDDETLPDFLTRLAVELVPRRLWQQGSQRIPVDSIVADPAGAARSAQTGIADLDLVALAPPRGLGILPRVERDPERRDIVSGCTRVNLALERGALTVERAMYEAGLRAPANKRTLARALTGYRWDERQPGRPSKDGTHDHHADTLRYAVREVLWYLPDESRREPPKPEQPRRHVQHDPMDMR
jgi:hypothetical protein